MNKKVITVFEHSELRVGKSYSGVKFEEEYLLALEKFHGDECLYFRLINNGIKLNENVGVISVGNLTIEVLPKADKNSNEGVWRDVLIGMLKAVGAFNVSAPSSSSLSLKSNYILDLYFELFLNEVEYLLARGLIKKYRRTEGNQLALKGALSFGKHISKNLVHQERFYVNYMTYDKEHQTHQILYKTLLLLKNINQNIGLNGRIGALLLSFPEQNDIKVTDATFEKLNLDRKSEPYRSALDISRLILLNYHPDLSQGRNNVLALMFNMNVLWEKFVYESLKKSSLECSKAWNIREQVTANFWKPEGGYSSYMEPDIVLSKFLGTYSSTGEKEYYTVVLDTKWKNIYSSNPSSQDLRQLYVYNTYFHAQQVALVYPGKEEIKKGNYYNSRPQYKPKMNRVLDDSMECSVIQIPAEFKNGFDDKDKLNSIREWQESIAGKIFKEYINI